MSGEFHVRTEDARTASPALLDAWAELEARTLEPNVYASPHFVLPALRWLDPHSKPTTFQVWKDERLCALLVASPSAGTRSFPMPHLVAYRSKHSYVSTMLLDEEHAEGALDALLGHLHASTSPWHGIVFERTWLDGPLFDLLSTRSVGHVAWQKSRRAVIRPTLDRLRLEASLAQHGATPAKRLRKLGEGGHLVTWSIADGGEALDKSIETFLDLEDTGWKAEQRTSLRASVGGAEFFREVAHALGQERRAVFVQLLVDGEVIASSSNFLSKRGGFAFKIGWKPERAKLSPGVQVELHLVKQLYEHPTLRELDVLDSGAEEGSYLDRLWPSRRVIANMAIATSTLGRGGLGVVDMARSIRREKRALERALRAPGKAEGG